MSTKRKPNKGNPLKHYEDQQEHIARQMQHLLGCEWGRSLKTPDDEEVCQERATHMTTVHNGPAQRTFKLCDKHEERLQQETTPRGEGG